MYQKSERISCLYVVKVQKLQSKLWKTPVPSKESRRINNTETATIPVPNVRSYHKRRTCNLDGNTYSSLQSLRNTYTRNASFGVRASVGFGLFS